MFCKIRPLFFSRPISPFETLKRYVPPSSLSRIQASSLKLDYNEATVPAHPAVTRAIADFVKDEKLFLYPALDGGLLRKDLMSANNLNPESQDLVVTAGSDEALRLLFAAFPGPVFVPQPTYPQIDMFGSPIHPWEPPADSFAYLKTSDDSLFIACDKLFTDALIAGASKISPSVVYLISPNNPNGHELSEMSIQKISDSFPKTLIILDQAYFEFASRPLSPEFRLPGNVVIVRTFSKCLGLAGLRLGYFFGGSDILVGPKNLSNSKAISSIAQIAGRAVLANSDFYKNYAKQVNNFRSHLVQHLTQQNVPIIAGGGNFICIQTPSRHSVHTVVKQLEVEHGIFVRDISGRFPGFFRVTIPGTDVQFQRVLHALDAVLV